MEHSIYLGNYKLGTTQLEKADAPMGVVFGVIKFIEKSKGYNFIKDYCNSNNIELASEYPDDNFVSTMTIDSLLSNNISFNISFLKRLYI